MPLGLKSALEINNPNDIVNRLKMMAVIFRVKKHVGLNLNIFKNINYDLACESSLLNIHSHEEKALLFKKYTTFRNVLDYKNQVNNYLTSGINAVKLMILK